MFWNNKFLFSSISGIILLLWVYYPVNYDINQENVHALSIEGVMQKLKSKESRIFITAEWCGGCKLTFNNVYLEEKELYGNEVFYFGSEKGLEHYLVDSVHVFWISDVTNTAFHHKRALSKILSKLDPSFEFNWGFPLIIEYKENRLYSF